MNKLNDELVRRIRNGDQDSFELLFSDMHKKLCSYAYIYVKNYDIANEIVHETFIKVWETRERLNENQSVRAYLYKCVHNGSINYLKNKQTSIQQTEDYKNNIIYYLKSAGQDEDEEIFEKLALDDLEVRIFRIIGELPGQCKEVFELSRFHDLTYNEIAERLGISVNSVKTQISRAFRKIREGLK